MKWFLLLALVCAAIEFCSCWKASQKCFKTGTDTTPNIEVGNGLAKVPGVCTGAGDKDTKNKNCLEHCQKECKATNGSCGTSSIAKPNPQVCYCYKQPDPK
uniref:Putative salivary protein n=1 Tax=Xenopsylla cheopis TaxID=163159 RepID=A2IAC9_XENCH|nr:putative salivary protein [Xenopsylla cheopis]